MKFHNHLNSWQVTTGCLQLAAVQLLCCVWFFVTPWTAATPVFPVLHYLPEPAQTHVQWVGDEIQPSRPLSFPSPPALNLSQHQGLFQWFGSSHQVAKYWNFSISPSNEYSGLLSFRINWSLCSPDMQILRPCFRNPAGGAQQSVFSQPSRIFWVLLKKV